MKTNKVIYLSVDVEADGPIPGLFSMLSLGCVAFDDQGKEISQFSVNLNRLLDALQDPNTMAWWAKNQKAYAATRINTKAPLTAMNEWLAWLKALPKAKLVFVGYPASYDFMFAYWYLVNFTGECPFGFQALDMKTLAMIAMDVEFHEVSKKTMPKKWFGSSKHSHIAVEDAKEQGELFFKILKEARGLHLDGYERGYDDGLSAGDSIK